MAKDSSPTRHDATKSTATGDDKDKSPNAGDAKSTATGDGPRVLTPEDEALAAARAPRIQSVLCAVEPIEYPMPGGKVGRIDRGEPLNGRLGADQVEQLAKRGLVQHRML